MGVYIVNFIFFIDQLWRRHPGEHAAPVPRSLAPPIMRIAVLTAFISALIIILLFFALAVLTACILLIHARLQSPIFWDVVAISTYLIRRHPVHVSARDPRILRSTEILMS